MATISDVVKMKESLLTLYFIDTHFDMTYQQQTAFENIVGKEEIAHYEQFLLFPQCFLLNQKMYPYLSIFMTSYLYFLMNKKSPNLG